MSPENLLRSMCERHGVGFERGRRLLPLVRRALRAPIEVRDRILFLVDRSLRGAARQGETNAAAAREADRDVLVAVARVLHAWTPSQPMLDLGATLPRKPKGDERAG